MVLDESEQKQAQAAQKTPSTESLYIIQGCCSSHSKRKLRLQPPGYWVGKIFPFCCSLLLVKRLYFWVKVSAFIFSENSLGVLELEMMLSKSTVLLVSSAKSSLFTVSPLSHLLHPGTGASRGDSPICLLDLFASLFSDVDWVPDYEHLTIAYLSGFEVMNHLLETTAKRFGNMLVSSLLQTRVYSDSISQAQILKCKYCMVSV